MLLQKTGWRIKQFISHRRNSSFEEYKENSKVNLSGTNHATKLSGNGSKRASCISQNSLGEIPTLQRATSNTATTSLPSPPTAHSSASSLCSCECAANPSTSSKSLSAAPPRMEPRPEILCLPPVSATSTGDAKTWRLIFPETSSRPPASFSSIVDAKCPSETTGIRSSTFNLLEALGIDPLDSDRTPTQSIRNTDDSDMENLSENVEQLIRETDKAFKAVATVLADTKEGWKDEPVPQHVVRNISTSQSVSRKESRPPVSTLRSPIQRTKSVAKGKRKIFYRKKHLPIKRTQNVPPPPVNTPIRWTLTDVTTNMVEIFNGKIFRTEVDEMLTPDRLRQLRAVKAENECRPSLESCSSAGTDGSAPTEPFHLESLSSRPAVVQLEDNIHPPFPSPSLPPPTIPLRRRSPTGNAGRAGKPRAHNTDIGGSIVDPKDLDFPTPPKISNRSNAWGTPPLPTIHEVSPLATLQLPPIYGRPKARRFSFESIQTPPDYFLLPSNSFTWTSPLFRHGPIRIEREKELLVEDEPLDWTAFQMAISGTMDEVGVDERNEIEWAADEAEVDDILQWWAGYKFPGYGQMIQASPLRGRINSELPSLEMQEKKPQGDSGTDKIVVESSVQAIPLRRVKNRYVESLPPSPMLDFVPSSPDKKDEVIPMGFNLGHDLGDFLDWETNYVRKYFVDD